MNNSEQIIPHHTPVQKILDQYLNSRPAAADLKISQDAHLDEDFLSAFIEGSLNRRESGAVTGHLLNCSFCRHRTAELIKLEYALADAPEKTALVETGEPAKISDVISGLLSKLFGSGQGAVFAHQENDEPDQPPSEEENKK